MRELKFRLFAKQSKEMITWDKMPSLYKLNVLNDNEDDDKYSPFMQYIGLRDKYDEEIYEGDIVKVKYTYEQNYLGGFRHEEIIGHVAFKHGCFDVYNRDLSLCHGIIVREHISDLETEWEVIGNIYENPELLSD